MLVPSPVQPAPFHERLDELVASALLSGDLGPPDPDLRAADDHASLGCSLCARAVVNARELFADLSASLATRSPSARLRERVLSSARARVLAPILPSPAPAPTAAASPGSKPRDPSATVAHMHLADPSEIERRREVSAIDARLAAHLREVSPRLESILAEVQRLTELPLLFINLIRGGRVGYLAERGLPEPFRGMGDMRREMTFCSHCVSAGRPLIVPDAASEPFFRGNPSVQRFGVKAYVGVPLRASSGVAIGTLCGLDYVPRSISPAVVRHLERFAEQVVAEIEPRRPLEAASA